MELFTKLLKKTQKTKSHRSMEYLQAEKLFFVRCNKNKMKVVRLKIRLKTPVRLPSLREVQQLTKRSWLMREIFEQSKSMSCSCHTLDIRLECKLNWNKLFKETTRSKFKKRLRKSFRQQFWIIIFLPRNQVEEMNLQDLQINLEAWELFSTSRVELDQCPKTKNL